MQITKTQPRAVYTLELDYTELHNLYHMMLGAQLRFGNLAPDEESFLRELKKHA